MELSTVPSNLSIQEAFVNRKRRIVDEEDVIKEKENQQRNIVIKRTTKPKGRRKPPAVPPVVNMVEPYTTQQFFDTPANITNGQLLALNQKFTMDVVKKLRKPITRKPNKGKGPAVAAETPRPEENELNREPIGAKPMDTAEVNEDDEYLAPQGTYNSSKK